ncbi:MAG: glycosyltransferase family 4 protein [Cyclobacteriaceae bacterium]
MKILLIDLFGKMAGSTYAIYHLTLGLKGRGHQITVLSKPKTFFNELLKDSDLRHIELDASGKFDFNSVRKIASVVTENSIDVIFSQGTTDRYLTIFAKWFYVPNVKLYHIRQQKPIAQNQLKGWFYQKGTYGIVAASDAVKQFLIDGGIDGDHITVINNSVEIPDLRTHLIVSERLRNEYKITNGDFVIGCVSRIKKQAQILEALTKIESPVVMIFVGINKSDIKNQNFGSVDHHKIIFTGEIDREKTLAHYPLLNLKILASDMEGFSLSILEAMNFSVPVIATKASGNTDLIDDGNNGLLFEDGNIDDLKNKILRLKSEAGLKEKLTEKGLKTVNEKYSYKRMIDQYEQLALNTGLEQS